MYSAWIALVAGLYMLTMGLITTAKDSYAKVLFKIVPVVLGMCLLFSAAQLFGWIVRV